MSEQTVTAGEDGRARGPALSARFIAAYVRFVFMSSRRTAEYARLGEIFAANEPLIVAGWHGGFLLAPILFPRPETVSAMVARHGDADLIGSVLERFGVRLLRGAGAGGKRKDKGGAAALRIALRELRVGRTIAMTADVPPGPARVAGIGVITAARLSGRPILPVVAATSRFLVLNTWSRFIVNLPFSKLTVLTGEPLLVPADADAEAMERARLELQRRLNDIGARAYRQVGARADKMAQMGAGGPPAPGLSLRLYRAALALAAPLARPLLRHRLERGKEDPQRLDERLGKPSLPRPQGFLIWIHAASVGETNAVLPLIQRLRRDYPASALLLTTGTLTSARIAAERLPAGALHQFIPLDVPRFAARFLDHWRPDLAIFVESEIWPNLVLESAARNIPMVLANARMSMKSYRRWRRRPGMARPLFGRFALILAQNEGLRQRFHRLGAPRVEAVGNLKFDSPPPPVDGGKFAELKQAVGDRPLLLAASTHAGEETLVLSAHKRVCEKLPGLLTIIVPRHPERGGEVAVLAAREGLGVARRSIGQLPDASSEIYVADTLGELGLFYSLGRVAFIGGSLIPHGGQNPIEAVALDAHVVCGPHVSNFADAYRALLNAGAARQVADERELAAVVAKLLADPEAMAEASSRAKLALAVMTGALARSCELLRPLIEQPDEDPHVA